MNEPELETSRHKQQILHERAKALAREPDRGEASEEFVQLVEFILASETYAIELIYLREVYPLRDLTPLPCTPPFVLGIINVRGQILTVLDIRKFFELPEKVLTDLNKVIIVHADEMELGILADAILGVRSIAISDIQPSLATVTGIRAEYLRGVTQERLVILDVARILSDKRIVVDEEVDA